MRNFLICDMTLDNYPVVDRIYAANGKQALKKFLVAHSMTGFDQWECGKVAGTYRIHRLGQVIAAID